MNTDLSDERFIPAHLSCFSDALEIFAQQTSKFSRICVAYSGGLDSTVLLHLLSLSPRLKGRLLAHHVNHDLQESASEWAKHCESVCLSLNIPFTSTQLQWPPVKREGVESVARRLRYQALTKGFSLEADVLVTGHHQRDQAETVLLNLARGAGVSGLAAMPLIKELSTSTGKAIHYRPLLPIPYQRLKAYAKHFKLIWVEDPSNALTRFRRNAIRQEVLPALSAHWPDVEKTLARTADNMSEAHTLLNRMAKQSLANIKSTEFYFDFDDLNDMDWLEQKNTLRYWLVKQFKITLSARHYEWIKGVLSQQAKSRKNAFSYQMSQGELCFYKHRLFFLKNKILPYHFKVMPSSDVSNVTDSNVRGNENEPLVLSLHEGVLHLNQSTLSERALYYYWQLEANLVFRLSDIVVRNISTEDDLDRKKLKCFFQKNKIPAWERPFWPVLTLNGELVSVLGCVSCLKTREISLFKEEGGEEKQPQLVQRLFLSQQECYRIMGNRI